MRSRFLSILAIVSVILIVYIAVRYAKDSYEMIPIPIDKMLAKDKWQIFYSDRDKFEARFPAYPKYSAERINGNHNDEKREYGVYEVLQNDNTLFMITVISYFNEKSIPSPELILEQVVMEIVGSDKDNRLINMSKLNLEKNPAVDFFVEKADLRMGYRAISNESTLYLLMYMAPKMLFSDFDYFYFLDSFHPS